MKKDKIHITLLQEELNSLLNFKKVEIFENDDITISISIEDNKENGNIRNILDRYNHEEYYELGDDE